MLVLALTVVAGVMTAPATAYPIERLRALAGGAEVIAAVRILSTATISGVSVADNERRVEPLAVLKGTLESGESVVVFNGGGSPGGGLSAGVPPEATACLVFIYRRGGRWHALGMRGLAGYYGGDSYYLDVKTALARDAGSTRSFRTKHRALSLDDASAAARRFAPTAIARPGRPDPKITVWEILGSSLNGDEWELNVRWKAETPGDADAQAFDRETFYIDAETGEVVETVVGRVL
jgi:hypothetical protein